MNTKTLLATALLMTMLLPTQVVADSEPSTPDSTGPVGYVAFNLRVDALVPIQGMLVASVGDVVNREPVQVIRGGLVDSSITLRTTDPAIGPWRLSLVADNGSRILYAEGAMSQDGGFTIGVTEMDMHALGIHGGDAPVTVLRGYASAVIHFRAVLSDDTAVTRGRLILDPETSGTNQSFEARANGTALALDAVVGRAAPKVPYVFTLVAADNTEYARWQGSFIFGRESGETGSHTWDAEEVVNITASADFEPHLRSFPVAAALFDRTVTGSDVDSHGPGVVVQAGNRPEPAAPTTEPLPRDDAVKQTSASDEAVGPNGGIGELVRSPTFIGAMVAILIIAALAVAGGRLLRDG